MSSLLLVVTSGPNKDKKYYIQEGTGKVLGRDQNADYQLNDPHTSRVHCEVQCDGSQVRLVHRSKTSPTFVNGVQITDHVLNPGDAVKIGSTILRFQVGDSQDLSTLPPGALQPRADDDDQAVAQLAELTGRTLAHFQIGEALGKGVSAVVFRAVDARDNKEVALKVMQPAFSQNEDEMQRFVRAMKTILPLRHPNLVALCGAGKTGPYCWIAMEFVDGEAMSKVIERIGVAGMLDWKYAFRVAVHVARALEYAHGQNIIHRNITPTNILMQKSDKQVKLGDLMLAKALEGTLAKEVTKPGELLGDVNYMSPERTYGASKVDGRSDLFSLGATVYALLTGKPPFAGSNLIGTIGNIRDAEPEKPTKFQMSIPGLFEGVILRLLSKAPEARFQTAKDLLEELERLGRFQGVSA